MISIERAQLAVPDRNALYKGMLRNQYVVPPLADTMVTAKWMMGVIEERFWCPKSEQVTYRVCADPPNRKDLAQMLFDLMVACDNHVSGWQATAEVVLKNPPSGYWTILLIASIDSNHALFARDYVRPKPVRNGKPAGKYVSAFNGFFDGLPQAARSKHSNLLSFTTKEEREKQRLQGMQDRIKGMQDKMAAEKQRLADVHRERAAKQAHSSQNPLDSSQAAAQEEEEKKTTSAQNAPNVVFQPPAAQSQHTFPNVIGNSDELDNDDEDFGVPQMMSQNPNV